MAMLQNDAARVPAPRKEPRADGLVRSLLASASTLLIRRRTDDAGAATDVDSAAQANDAAHPDPAVAAEQQATDNAAVEHDALRHQLELAVADLDARTADRDGRTPVATRRPPAG